MTLSTESLVHTQPDLVQTAMSMPPRTYTVYLIRHGEALHNVEEKVAQKRALQSSLQRGLDKDHKETIKSMNDARKKVLLDPAFFDAEITEAGRLEARKARDCLQNLVDQGLPPPMEVLTSPLQRCLGTVEEIFLEPEVKIRVEEDLRERLTGRPADNRHSSDTLEESFPRFDFSRLRALSVSNLMDAGLADSDVSTTSGYGDDDQDLSRHSSFDYECSNNTPSSKPFFKRFSSSLNTDVEIEDESAVRKRAFKLFRMLEQAESDSVAVVTHKGFLRALECGCFGVEDATEFTNCEVRVYQIEMSPDEVFPNKIERLK